LLECLGRCTGTQRARLLLLRRSRLDELLEVDGVRRWLDWRVFHDALTASFNGLLVPDEVEEVEEVEELEEEEEVEEVDEEDKKGGDVVEEARIG